MIEQATDAVFVHGQVIDQLVKSGDMEALEGEVPEATNVPKFSNDSFQAIRKKC